MAFGGGEVAAATFLEGMAEAGAIEGFGVAGTGLTAAELGTGAAAGLGTDLLTTGALTGGTAGGISSLTPALQTVLTNTAAVNPAIASQVANAAAAGAVPSAASALGTGQIGSAGLQGLGAGQLGDLALTDASLGAAGEINAQAAQEAFRQASTAAATPGITSGVQPLQAQLPAVPNVTPAFGPGSTAATLSSMPAPTAADIAQMANVGMPAAEPGLGSLLSQGYNAWKNSDPFIKYGSAGLAAAKYLGKPTSAYAPPGYSGPLSKFTYNPNTYTPYTYKPYAAGGPVEEMSRENAMGANTGYPQADIRQGAYATPWQTPVSRNVVAGADDANLDIMTGAERMAEGGEASSDAGDTGIAALGPMMYSPSMMSSSLVDPAEAYAAAQPMMDMSRQNFQDFLARYQNLPITEAAPAPVTYTGLYAGEGPKPVEVPYDPGWGGYSGAGGGRVSPDGFGGGGISNLGSYSDGGRLLKGPGDGMSDNIPASISGKQPARLADGEFVVPADVVSGLGNGSTDAGAKQLYKMLDKVRAARTGTKKQGKQIKPEKYTPA